ncbi:MAG: hypothetical protein ABFQ95_02030 [Pseudomonadota bacterium]
MKSILKLMAVSLTVVGVVASLAQPVSAGPGDKIAGALSQGKAKIQDLSDSLCGTSQNLMSIFILLGATPSDKCATKYNYNPEIEKYEKGKTVKVESPAAHLKRQAMKSGMTGGAFRKVLRPVCKAAPNAPEGISSRLDQFLAVCTALAERDAKK